MARLFTPSESKYYLMALDAGTGSIRAVIFDLEGNQIAVGQRSGGTWQYRTFLVLWNLISTKTGNWRVSVCARRCTTPA